MSQSLSKVYIHITFSTKNRQNLIDDSIKASLHEHKNHIHVLCILSRKVAQMKLLEEIKKRSSKWVKTKGKSYSNFYWQDGYGIFSINPTETDKFIDYIQNQDKHHKQMSFQDEFRAFLIKYKVEYDERYVWD